MQNGKGRDFRVLLATSHPRMMSSPLDNPFYASLCSRHRELALGGGDVVRYPAGVAPFLGIADADVDGTAAFETLIAPDEAVYLIGVAPARLPAGWVLEAYRPLAQMVCDAPIPLIDGPEISELSAADRADVLALTALVYPHYFRPRAMELGRYFGIHQDGRLGAMIGERLGMDGLQEMSAICTHPDFSGRGYARRLTAFLTNDNLARGRLPFLHVSHENPRAERLYEQLGYVHRRDIGFWSLHRAQ